MTSFWSALSGMISGDITASEQKSSTMSEAGRRRRARLLPLLLLLLLAAPAGAWAHATLLGTLATGAGTLYIEREKRRDAMRVVHHVAERLQAGEILAVFPEGTTSNGIDLLPFHANLIQSAVSAKAPVQPVGLRFISTATGQPSLAPCYIGDDTLLGSFWRTLTAPGGITVVVAYGTAQQAEGRDRRAWAAALQGAVAELREG